MPPHIDCHHDHALGNVKSAVDVLDDMCQASLLHLTNAAVSRLIFFLWPDNDWSRKGQEGG